MRKLFVLGVLALALPALVVAFKLPPMALGPYVGAYLLDCTTINNEVLCVNGDPSLGVAPLFGTDLKLYLPENYYSEITIGYSTQKTEAGDFSTSNLTSLPDSTTHTSGILVLLPLSLTLGRDFQLMPKLWGSAGLSAGYTWAAATIDSQAIYSGGIHYDSHTVGRGGNPFLGFKLGIDLYVHRNVDVSVSFGYRYGDITELTVREADRAERIGSTIKYFDKATNTEKPLPLEISNPILCYAIKYRF